MGFYAVCGKVRDPAYQSCCLPWPGGFGGQVTSTGDKEPSWVRVGTG